CDVTRLDTTLDGFGLSNEHSRCCKIEDDKSRVDRGTLVASCNTCTIALITGSSSSSYVVSILVRRRCGGEGGGGILVSGNICRLKRFGLRGLCSPCVLS